MRNISLFLFVVVIGISSVAEGQKYDKSSPKYSKGQRVKQETLDWSEKWPGLGCDSEQSCMKLLAQYVEGGEEQGATTERIVELEAQLQAANEEITSGPGFRAPGIDADEWPENTCAPGKVLCRDGFCRVDCDDDDDDDAAFAVGDRGYVEQKGQWLAELEAQLQKRGCDSEESCMELVAQYVEGGEEHSPSFSTNAGQGATTERIVELEAQLQAANEEITSFQEAATFGSSTLGIEDGPADGCGTGKVLCRDGFCRVDCG